MLATLIGMTYSVTAPLTRAVEFTQKSLFEPFRMEKWFCLGFISMLAHVSEPKSFPFFPFNGEQLKSSMIDPSAIKDSILRYGVGFVVIAVLGFGLFVLMTWVSSRARLMWAESVARDQWKISEPWTRFRELGLSLFAFRMLMMISTFLISALFIGMAVLILNVQNTPWFEKDALKIWVTMFALWLPVGLAYMLIASLLDDFVVPVMALEKKTVSEAWSAVLKQMVTGNVRVILLFYSMKFLVDLGVGVAMMMAICFTCCIAAIPYLSAVILLPLVYFSRAYSLFFLEQFGFQISGSEPVPPAFQRWSSDP